MESKMNNERFAQIKANAKARKLAEEAVFVAFQNAQKLTEALVNNSKVINEKK
jgi:hypothetical protein